MRLRPANDRTFVIVRQTPNPCLRRIYPSPRTGQRDVRRHFQPDSVHTHAWIMRNGFGTRVFPAYSTVIFTGT